MSTEPSSPLEMETVEKYSSKYKRKYDKRKAKCKRETDDDSEPEKWYSKLENWYSTDVGKLPLHFGAYHLSTIKLLVGC